VRRWRRCADNLSGKAGSHQSIAIITQAFQRVTIELSDVSKGYGVEGAEGLARTVEYAVILRNPTEYEHLVIYSVSWSGRSFPPATDRCNESYRKDEYWWDSLTGSEVLQPFESITKPNEYQPYYDCFDFELSRSDANIIEIDGFDWVGAEQALAKLEGRKFGY
jgi:hypothetical protein